MKNDLNILETRKQRGQLLKAERKRLGITLAEIQRITGLCCRDIKAIEEGRYNYGIDSFIKFQYVLNFIKQQKQNS